jgi:hypothetical protein
VTPTAATLLADLRRRGVELRPEGAGLRYRAPVGVMTEDVKAKVAAVKADVLALLEAEADPLVQTALALFEGAAIAAVEPVLPRVCKTCGSARWWRSVHGPVICAVCHPPAADRLVAAWLGEPEAEPPS